MAYEDKKMLASAPRADYLPDQYQSYLNQWEVENESYKGIGSTTKELPPNLYTLVFQQTGLYFTPKPLSTHDLIKFQDSAVDEIMKEINIFWKSEDKYKKFDVQYKRGVLMYGPPGCHSKGTKIIMYDGSVKNVEDIEVGDVLCGPDSKPRKVLQLCRGQDEMYEITPVKGDKFVVNGHHILHLARSRNYNSLPQKLNISVNDYLSLSKPSQEKFKLLKPNNISFTNNKKLLIDPYYLGVWLGDGNSKDPNVTSMDKEIADYLSIYSKNLGLNLITVTKSGNNKAKLFRFSSKGSTEKTRHKNVLINLLRKEKLLNNKHIPHHYLTASIEDRLQLLAGIIDTDGSYSEVSWRASDKAHKKGYKGHFDIIQKSKILTDNIIFLAKSLGFGVNCKKCTKTIKSKNFSGEYYRMSIFGDIYKIPVKLPRKQAGTGKPNKNPLVTGIKYITPIGIDNYYGFTLDKDHLYMTDDFTIHHNSGKSSIIKMLIRDVISRGGIAIDFTDARVFEIGMDILRKIHPTKPVVCIMEDIESIVNQQPISGILNLLDGSTNYLSNIVFVATSNYPEALEARIKDRPSRFDRVIEVGLPSAEMRKVYLEHLFNNAKINKKVISKWIQDTDTLTFPHLQELFLSVYLYDIKYEDALGRIKSMSKSISSDKHRKKMDIAEIFEDDDDDYDDDYMIVEDKKMIRNQNVRT